MIEIKRNCNSSILDDPVQKKITFGAFTVKISEEDYEVFDMLRIVLKAKPDELLQTIISEGLEILFAQAGVGIL